MDLNVTTSMLSEEKKDWAIWSNQYLAKVRIKGCRNVVTGVDQTSVKDTKGYEDFMQRNDIAFSKLIIAYASE